MLPVKKIIFSASHRRFHFTTYDYHYPISNASNQYTDTNNRYRQIIYRSSSIHHLPSQQSNMASDDEIEGSGGRISLDPDNNNKRVAEPSTRSASASNPRLWRSAGPPPLPPHDDDDADDGGGGGGDEYASRNIDFNSSRSSDDINNNRIFIKTTTTTTTTHSSSCCCGGGIILIIDYHF